MIRNFFFSPKMKKSITYTFCKMYSFMFLLDEKRMEYKD